MSESWDEYLSGDGDWTRRYDRGLGAYFCHIPRTGGSTLAGALHACIDASRFPACLDVPARAGQIAGNHYNRALYAIERT